MIFLEKVQELSTVKFFNKILISLYSLLNIWDNSKTCNRIRLPIYKISGILEPNIYTQRNSIMITIIVLNLKIQDFLNLHGSNKLILIACAKLYLIKMQ